MSLFPPIHPLFLFSIRNNQTRILTGWKSPNVSFQTHGKLWKQSKLCGKVVILYVNIAQNVCVSACSFLLVLGGQFKISAILCKRAHPERQPGEERGIKMIEASWKSPVVVQVPCDSIHKEIDSCLDKSWKVLLRAVVYSPCLSTGRDCWQHRSASDRYK